MRKNILILVILGILLLPSQLAFSQESYPVFYLQFGVYNDFNSASELFYKLHQLGLEPYVDTFGEYTKVLIGSFTNINGAKEAMKKVTSLGYESKIKTKELYLKNNEIYRVQIASFGDVNNALKTIAKLQGFGYNVNSYTEDNLIKIYVGDYNSHTEAEYVYKEAIEDGFSPIIKEMTVEQLLGIKELKQEDRYNGEEIKNYILGDDVLLEGLFGSHTIFFYKNANWILTENPFVELSYQRNQVEKLRNSSLSILINDVPVYSEITKDENSIRVYFEKDQISNGYNTLSIKCFNRISDIPCEDDINPANWFKILGSSHIQLRYLLRDDNTDMKDFPYPYTLKGLNVPIKANIILPPNADNQEIASGLMFSSLLGSIESEQDASIKYFSYNEKINITDSHLIFIGKRASLPKDYKQYFNQGELTNNSTILKEVISPYSNDKKLLLILWGSEESYLKALKLLLDTDVVKQLSNNYLYVDDDTVVPSLTDIYSDRIELKTLGYTGISASGLFNHSVKYDLRVPSNWEPTDNVVLNLHMRYSDILDFEKSLVTVYVNNIPIGSKKLSETKTDDDLMQFTFNKDAFSSIGYYSIEVNISLYKKETYCETMIDKNVWAYIVEDSYIDFPHEITPNFTLNKYDGLFMNDQVLESYNLLLPSNPSKHELNAAFAISNHLGRFAKDLSTIKVFIGEVPKNLSGDAIAIYTIKAEDSFSKQVNEYAYVKYNSNSMSYESTEKIPLVEKDFISSLQIVPYNNEFQMLIMNGTDDVALNQAKNHITKSSSLYMLNGDVSLINADGVIKTKIFNENLAKKISNNQKNSNQKPVRKPWLNLSFNFNNIKAITMIVSIMVIIIGTFIYIKKK